MASKQRICVLKFTELDEVTSYRSGRSSDQHLRKSVILEGSILDRKLGPRLLTTGVYVGKLAFGSGLAAHL